MKEERTILVKLVTTAELAERLNVSTRTISRLRAAGVIVPVMITPYCLRYDVEDVLTRLRERGDIS
mgnify:CR=1 FL=1